MKSALNENVLVLNRLWQAVNICTARRALCLLFQGHAQVVHSDGKDYTTLDFDGWRDFSVRQPQETGVIQAISFRIRVPKVILLLFFDRLPRKDVKLTRHNIFERDKHQCQYCGRTLDHRGLNLDHIIPRDRGGLTTWENIVCSCIDCNTLKGNRTPREAGLKLLHPPRRPKWRPFLTVSHARHPDESWRHFLDPNLWDVELGESVSA
ncbi:MAG: HNH endonuclease [Verrucomicrobia bacterium]|nr:HNH endonuclease [Verrucomicrobiota bacterium]